MKKKILGIFVCMLLIAATVLPVLGNVKIESLKEKTVGTGDSKAVGMASLSEQSLMDVWNKKLEKSYDRAYSDYIAGAQQTTDDGYIAIGDTDTYGAGDYDAWLIKTDSNGSEQWNKTFGGASADFALGGQQTSDGGYIISGSTQSYGAGSFDVWLIKTYSNGNEEWKKTYGSSGNEHGYFVHQTSDGGYIITGRTASYGNGSCDVWLIKTDANGDEEWNKTFGGVLIDFGFVVRQIDDGYIITGMTASFGSNYISDVWLIKTDSNGNKVWSETYGGPYADSGHDVQQTTDGGYIIIGSTSSYGDLDHDFYLIKTDSNGNEEWNKTFDGDNAMTDVEDFGYGSGMSVRQITDGYIMTGITDAPYGGGSLDILLIETDDEGNEIWNKTYGGENVDEGYWLNETSDGGYILSGITTSYGTSTIDGWLIKTDSNGNEDWNKTFGSAAPDNDPPNDPSTPDGPDEGTIGIEYMFNTSTEDPDDDDVYYKFDWGDGTDSGWVGPYPSGDIGSAAHVWNDEGDYNIKAKAMDENGETSDWSPILTIHITGENEPPYKPRITGPNSGKIGETYDFTFEATDPQDHDVYFYIEWGDGEIEDWIGPYNSDEEITLNHTWDEKNTYTIKVKAKDIYDAESQEATLRVTIPKYKIFIFNFPLLNWLFERFPKAFPILRYILEL